MTCQVQFCAYERQLEQPLRTSHGDWYTRVGILVRLATTDNKVGFGDITPLPWFGSETLEQALDFCQQLPHRLSIADLETVPASLPACQFGLESALAMLSAPSRNHDSLPWQPSAVAALLPTGVSALEAWQPLWVRGYRTWKWKIGIQPVEQETAWLQELCAALPRGARLRLDANGGLTEATARQWLQVCDRYPQIEFLEQPLPPNQLEVMLRLAKDYSTPLALDESVATLRQLVDCHQRGWSGVMVIKPAIVGSPRQLCRYCQEHAMDIVMSSALETAIGHWAGWQLAITLGNAQRAMGYGVSHWFTDNWNDFLPAQFEQLWQLVKASRARFGDYCP